MNIRPNEHIEIRLHRSKDFFFKRINVNVGLLESQEYANSFLTVWHSTFRAHKKSIPAVPIQGTFFLCCKTWDLNFSILRKSFIREKSLSEQLIHFFAVYKCEFNAAKTWFVLEDLDKIYQKIICCKLWFFVASGWL